MFASTTVTLGAHTPAIAFTLVMVIGAALKPTPAPRTEVSQHSLSTSRRKVPAGRSVAANLSTNPIAGVVAKLAFVVPRRSPAVDAMSAAIWCDELARSIRSGATLTAALRTSPAPPGIGATVTDIRLSLDRGRSASHALAHAGSASPHIDLVLTVLRACADHGGPAAEPLDRAAATLRVRAADRADRLTHSAQARMSALVMTCLPVAMLALMLATSGSVRAAAVSPVGFLAIAVGAVLNAAGWLWMRRTIERDAS